MNQSPREFDDEVAGTQRLAKPKQTRNDTTICCSRNPRGAKTKNKYSETNSWKHISCDLDHKHKCPYDVSSMEFDDGAETYSYKDAVLVPGLSVVVL